MSQLSIADFTAAELADAAEAVHRADPDESPFRTVDQARRFAELAAAGGNVAPAFLQPILRAAELRRAGQAGRTSLAALGRIADGWTPGTPTAPLDPPPRPAAARSPAAPTPAESRPAESRPFLCSGCGIRLGKTTATMLLWENGLQQWTPGRWRHSCGALITWYPDAKAKARKPRAELLDAPPPAPPAGQG